MDTLYLKLPQKKNSSEERITLGNVAEIICTDKVKENKIKAILLKKFSGTKKQRAIFSVNDIIAEIYKLYPGMSIVPLGEVDTIIEYIPKEPSKFAEIIKIAIVSLISFVGAAFTIMTFNNDVSVNKLFKDVYYQLTGNVSDGFTTLELFYSLGLPLGILVFFNHFFGHKLSEDPTPLEVEIEQYEFDVNKSVISSFGRKEKQ